MLELNDVTIVNILDTELKVIQDGCDEDAPDQVILKVYA